MSNIDMHRKSEESQGRRAAERAKQRQGAEPSCLATDTRITATESHRVSTQWHSSVLSGQAQHRISIEPQRRTETRQRHSPASRCKGNAQNGTAEAERGLVKHCEGRAELIPAMARRRMSERWQSIAIMRKGGVRASLISKGVALQGRGIECRSIA